MKLRYTGGAAVGVPVPLPEGWPAADHEEPDRQVAARKISSGYYVAVDSSTNTKKRREEVAGDASD